LRDLGRQPVSATADAFSSSTIDTLLLNAMLELHMRVIPGTSDDQQAAMLLSGDLDLVLGDPYEFDSQFKSGELIPILKLSTSTQADTLAGVPAVADVVSKDVPRELVFLLETLGKSGHLIAAAPSTDPIIVEALRAAFERVAHDPAFVEEMAGRRIAIAPTSGTELTERLDDIVGASSAPLQAALQSYLACGKRMSDEGALSCE
jgi:tripartite-type tricarboxylate transporter receptor subunit TctC